MRHLLAILCTKLKFSFFFQQKIFNHYWKLVCDLYFNGFWRKESGYIGYKDFASCPGLVYDGNALFQIQEFQIFFNHGQS